MEWQVLYHYTTVETFYKIVQSGEFRLFDITKSNDPLEGIFAINMLEKAYDELYRNKKLTKSKYKLAHRAFFLFNEDVFGFGRLKELIMSASFCIPEHELYLWRCYGDNGKGVAIGVDVDMLKQIADETDGMTFQKIEYLSDSAMLERAEQFWVECLAVYTDDESEDIIYCDYEDKRLLSIIEKIKSFYLAGYFIKNIANQDENEYRLIYTAGDLTEYCIPAIGPAVCEGIDFISTQDDLKAYYAIQARKTAERNQFISNVALGPLCNIKGIEANIFLKRHNLEDCSVYHGSTISMR